MPELGKLLVTGSSGTIGTRLCEKFLEMGVDFVGADKKPNEWNKVVNELTLICDLTKKESIEKIPKDIDLVIHLAANARVYDLVVKPQEAMENIEMLFNILEYCRKNNVKRFIFASSREVYGNSRETYYKEENVDIRKCESPYAASKMSGETLVHSYKECYGIDFIILRFSNVYGMYDSSDRVIPEFIRRTLKNQDLIVYGKDKLLDFTYIDDCIDGIVNSVQRFDGSKNNIFNMSSGKGTNILEAAENIRSAMAGSNKIVISDSRTGEVTKFIGDITKARNSFDYNPKTGIDEGIKNSIEWYKKNVRE